MFLKTFFSVLITVFLAEIGDKTQLATLLYSCDKSINRWTVFLGSSMALVLAAGIGVAIGSQLEKIVPLHVLKVLAGVGFIIIGIWTLITR
jgi:putative Ca2+/H+ antiporter (TMEM165/GDT1 family)